MRHNPAAFLAVLLCAASAHSDTLPARVAGWPAGSAPSAPLNFRVTAYARGLDHPCSLLVLPNGDLLVAEARGARAQSAARPSANRITLLRDSSGSGAADRQYPLIEGLPRPFGLALRRDRLYVGASDAVYACPFLVGQTRLHGTCHAVLALPEDDGHGQWTRNLALSPDETTLYVADDAGDTVWRVTFKCAACTPDPPAPAGRR